ncbi:IPT/TIG domain-containing protein [Niabella aquatica]
MRNIIKAKSLLALLVLLLPAVWLQSCKKDKEEVTTGEVVLLSFGPTGVKHGEEIRFIGHNLDKVTAIVFAGTGAVVDKATFTAQTATLITLVVPHAAERGKVILKTSSGDIISKSMFDMGVGATVTSVTGEARPGANITIHGTFLNWVTSVTFGGDKLVENFVSKKFDELVVTVPADAKTGPLLIVYSGTEAGDFETTEILTVTLPLATAFSPAAVKHGDNVTIKGTDLDLVKKIVFPGVATAVTEFVSQSATELLVKVPGATTRGRVKLEAASGVQTESANELNIILPAITQLAPNPVDPGADLTITGTNLDLVTAILFENVTNPVTSFVSQSATKIVVKVPTGIANGLVTLKVLNSVLTVQSSGILEITGAAPPPVIALHLYDDAVVNWNGWVGDGWGGTRDYANSTPVRVGSKSIKVVYNAGSWGSPIQLGNGNISLAPYTMFKLSVYPTAGTAGMTLNIQFNGGNYSLVLGAAGEWKDYAIPVGSLTSDASLTQLTIQDMQGIGGTIYVDEIGLN